MRKPEIELDKTASGCDKRLCYSIRPKLTTPIPAKAIALKIFNSVNPSAVEYAGDFEVETQQYDVLTGEWYGIDKGMFPSDFLTSKGSISVPPGAKTTSVKVPPVGGVEVLIPNYQTWHEGQKYRVPFKLGNYVAAGGLLTVFLPPSADGRGVKIVSNPYVDDTGAKLWESSIDGLETGARTVGGVQVKGYNEVVDLRAPCRALLKACVENPDTPRTEAVCKTLQEYERCVKVDCMIQDEEPEVRDTYDQVTFVAGKRVEPGEYHITFGGVRNPLSTTPTAVFRMLTRDNLGKCVGFDILDNIVMQKMRTFDELEITQSSPRNGEQSVYAVGFTATTPIVDGDLFSLAVPSTIRTPADPLCVPVECLAPNLKDAAGKLTLLACTSEKGRIVLTLSPKTKIVDGKPVVDPAGGEGAKFKF